MAGLNTPFDYSSNLIGQEIIFRALSQQERFAETGAHGATWNQQDSVEKSQAYYQANVMRTDFSIPSKYEHCRPEPPCPWDKEGDNLTSNDLMPILLANDGVYTYSFKVAQRNDNTNGFTVGPVIAQYAPDQSRLDTKIQSEFTYLAHAGVSKYVGPAVIVVERSHRGNVENTFNYLFNMT